MARDEHSFLWFKLNKQTNKKKMTLFISTLVLALTLAPCCNRKFTILAFP